MYRSDRNRFFLRSASHRFEGLVINLHCCTAIVLIYCLAARPHSSLRYVIWMNILVMLCLFSLLVAAQTIDKHHLTATTSSQLPKRSMSPSPRRLVDFKKKQTSVESNGSTSTNGSTQVADVVNPQTDIKGNDGNVASDGKFENISDNGSEISDEGYRSLGLIQQANNQSKRISLHSQTSTEDVKVEDAKNNGNLSGFTELI